MLTSVKLKNLHNVKQTISVSPFESQVSVKIQKKREMNLLDSAGMQPEHDKEEYIKVWWK